jgi:cytochrome b561
MTVRNTRLRYGAVAMTLHWLIAAFVVANICLGLYFESLPDTVPGQPPPYDQAFVFGLIQLHKSIGLSVLMLSVLRLLWRLVNPVPALPLGMNPALRAAARTTHFLLYFLIIAIPLSGWLWVSASTSGLPTMYFGLFKWPYFSFLADLSRAEKRPWSHEFHVIHVYLAWAMIALIPIHVGGALYHQFIRRDDVLKRMLPGTKVTEPA